MNTAVRVYDPFNRFTVGFDNLFDVLDRAATQSKFPPYDIEKLENDGRKITLAVAGFNPDDINVVVENNQLTISAETVDDDSKEYVHKGIATRNFRLSWQLEQHYEVVSATCDNGLLAVTLDRKLPEELKPRRIAISRG